MTKTTSGLSENLPKYLVLGAFGLGAMALFYNVVAPGPEPASAGLQQPASVIEPRLPDAAVEGKVLFDKNCATCHGEKAAGTDHGPTFINTIYNPGHHSDEAFYSAAQNGVRRHHWPFGDMPAQPQVDGNDVAEIVTYVRELQTANGIAYEPHKM